MALPAQVMRAALFFIAHAAASRLPNEAVVPLYDVPVVDPAGQLIVHEKGLRPHHTSGAASDDPLLFRHRYQHHDAATDSLLYYQYEAKWHPNVVMLTDMVDSCEASDGGGGDNVTDIKLAISVPMNMTNGTIIVGDVNCTFQEADGTSSPWRSTLRERVLSSSIASAADSLLVNLRTVHAALNEIFEHAQLEIFHGRPHALEATRSKRLASLANNGGYDDKYGFASADEVIAEAKHAVARRQLANAARPQKQEKSSPQNASSSNRRELYHTSCGGRFEDGAKDDFWMALEGDRCSDDRPGSGMEGRTCYWKTGAGEDAKFALKAGNEYTLRWKSNTNERVEIFVHESDGGWGSTHCADLQPDYWIPNEKYTGPLASSPNKFTFTMPDLRKHACADDWFGGFPEFIFRIQTESECHRGQWPQGAKPFVFLSDWSDTLGPGGRFEPPSQSVVTFGNQYSGASLTCNDCSMTGSANVHVLIRVDQYNPFAESWSWADSTLEANVDLTARASGSVDKNFGSVSVLPSGRVCISPICFGVKFAGIDVQVGMIIDLELSARMKISAEADLKYRRSVKAVGTFGLHTRGACGRECILADASGFEQRPGAEGSVSSPSEAMARLSLSAEAEVGVRPSLYVGLFASLEECRR